MTHDTVSMADCASAFNKSMVTTTTVCLTYRNKVNTTKWLVTTLNRLHHAMITVNEASSNPLCGTNQ